MQSLDWSDMHTFLEVSRRRTLSEAADHLGINQTTVSRRLGELELNLGVKLFDRDGRSWKLTSAGESIVEMAEQMDSNVDTIHRLVRSNSTALSGRLSISADSCMQHLLVPIIVEFTSQYRDIEIDYFTSDAGLDLASERADVSVRGTNSPTPNVLGKRICGMESRIYGTRGWLEKIENGDANGISAVIWGRESENIPVWLKSRFPDIQSFHRINSVSLLVDLVRSGAGIGSIGCLLADPVPELHRLPVEAPHSPLGVWVLSHPDLRTTARVRVFRDFVVAKLSEKTDLFEGHCQKKIV